MRLLYIFILALAMLPVSARAFESPAKDPQQLQLIQDFGASFLPIADKFDCHRFAWGNILQGDAVMILEFIPRGTKSVKEWTRMMTVTVYALSENPDVNKTLMTQLMAGLEKYHTEKATVFEKEYFQSKENDEKALYLYYRAGQGVLKEKSAGIFTRISSSHAAFIQIQSRGSEVSLEDRNKIKRLLTDKTFLYKGK